MKRDSIDIYDKLPPSMIDYLSNYGRHFNQKLYNFAISKMKAKNTTTGVVEKLIPFTKSQVDDLLEEHNIELVNNQLYDYLYVANMCKADFLYKSIPDESHLALYVKDVIDDIDAYDGIVFNRWYADTRRQGITIDWDNMI